MSNTPVSFMPRGYLLQTIEMGKKEKVIKNKNEMELTTNQGHTIQDPPHDNALQEQGRQEAAQQEILLRNKR